MKNNRLLMLIVVVNMSMKIYFVSYLTTKKHKPYQKTPQNIIKGIRFRR